MSGTTRAARAIALPGLAWALHFIAIYALISAACAPRALLGFPALVIASGAVTVAALAICLWPVLRPLRQAPAELARAGFWSGLIFALASLANVSALLFFQSCGG